MSSATMTLIGMNNFLQYFEKDLFQELSFPTGIDKDIAIQNIMLFCGDNELLYPDGDFMIHSIGLWSTKWYRTFDKWIKALAIEYAPLENYDRFENWSDSASSSESMSSSESSSASASDSSSGSTSMNNDVSAFNASTMQDDTASASQTNTHASSISGAQSGSKSTQDKTDLSVHGGRIHGNIGVTTSQQMLQAELDISRFNIYDEIAIIFYREFCLAL